MSDQSSVFIDTAGWIALLNATDPGHDEADRIFRALGAAGRRVLVSDWIVAETGNGLARTAAREPFVRAVERFRRSEHAEIVYVTEALLQRGLVLYAARADKS